MAYMKIALCVISLWITIGLAKRTTFELSPVDWIAYYPQINYNVAVAAKKDLFLHLDAVTTNTFVLAVRRRDSDGYYQRAVNITEGAGKYFGTNGKWIASTALERETALVSIDENNQLSNVAYVPVIGNFILSDDTFVGFNGSVSETIFVTYEYDSVTQEWTEIPDTRLTVNAVVEFYGDLSTCRVTDTHLIYVDASDNNNVTVPIYRREADKSWTFVEYVPISVPSLGSVAYNGVDTVLFSLPTSEGEGGTLGYFFLYTKINGEWVEQKFTGPSLGYLPLGIIGFVTVFSGPDTLFVSAGAEGFSNGGNIEGGKVLMLIRNAETGLWEPALDFIGSFGLFGLGFAFNDYDFIVPSLVSTNYETAFFTTPMCFDDPINVTCTNTEVNDCSEISTVGLYTINNPQCGVFSAKMDSFGFENNQKLSAQFTFNRGYGPDFSCNATVTCPAPPVAPVASVPVSPPTKTTSSANVLGVGFLTAITLVVILVQ